MLASDLSKSGLEEARKEILKWQLRPDYVYVLADTIPLEDVTSEMSRRLKSFEDTYVNTYVQLAKIQTESLGIPKHLLETAKHPTKNILGIEFFEDGTVANSDSYSLKHTVVERWTIPAGLNHIEIIGVVTRNGALFDVVPEYFEGREIINTYRVFAPPRD